MRRIFNKRKSNIKKKLFLLFIFFFLIIIIYYFFIKNQNKFIIINEYDKNYYIIPEDRGGEKVSNIDKKSLNLTTKNNYENSLIKPKNLLFSIQFYTNNELKNVTNYLDEIINIDESIYKIEDFYILSFISEIGIEYFLLYKNFKNRENAKNYCLKYLSKIENCLIVDTTKF